MVHRLGIRAGRSWPLLATILVLAANWACGGDDIVAPRTASLVLTTATSGDDRDSNGYAFSLDGGPVQPIGVDTSVLLNDLASGAHAIELSGLASNCAFTSANPRRVTLASGDSASLKFTIFCSAVTGGITATTATTGSGRDLDGYLLALDGGAPQTIVSSGQLTLPGLPPGPHSLELSGLAANCTLTGDNPRQVDVQAGVFTPVRFQVSCAGTGVTVTTVTTGSDPDPDGYQLSLNGDEPRPLQDNGTLDLQLAPGDYRLEVSSIASNCRLSGENPRSVSLPLGSVVAMTFAVSCKSRVAPPAVLLFWGGKGTPHLYRTDGSTVVDLTPNSNGQKGRWSPDRSRIVFETVRNDHTEIFMMKADGSAPIRIAAGSNPDWSPDGTRIVFQSGGAIAVIKPDGSGMIRLTQGESDGDPAWSPDGMRIAFSRRTRTVCRLLQFFDVICAEDIYTIAPDGTGLANLTNITDATLRAREPAWSPDGSRIAFTRQPFLFASDVWSMRADGTEPTNLTNTSGIEGIGEASPVWSTDGSVIAISRAEANGPERLATILAAGGAASLLPGVPQPAIPSSWR